MDIDRIKLAAIVITYYPSKAVVVNILSYSQHFETLYIFDNTPTTHELKDAIAEIPGAIFFHDGENRGIPERLNSGCRMAIADGFQWALTMDQDTSFHPETIRNYLDCFSAFAGKEKVAAFGTRYSRIAEQPNPICNAEQILDVITSGMLLNLTVWKQIRGFDEALFIDSVDQEYCVRAGMAGYPTFHFTNIHIQHEVGTEVYRGSYKSLYLIKKRKLIHSPLRCYYMYRNMLYLAEKYQDLHPEFVGILRKNVITHMKICRNYGREKKALEQYIEIAKEDYKNNQMRKIASNRMLR